MQVGVVGTPVVRTPVVRTPAVSEKQIWKTFKCF